jgi:NADH-quinone oxidoreductase subunit E
VLSDASKKLIDREVAKYPAEQKQSACMSALAIAQDEHGWLSNDVMNAVADYLSMPAVAVYEVATFYNMYNLKPMGQHKLTVCTNLPCALSGGVEAAEYLKKRLGVNWKEMTKDGKFSVVEGECMGACGDAPVMLVNNKRMCSFMKQDKMDALIAELSAVPAPAVSTQR